MSFRVSAACVAALLVLTPLAGASDARMTGADFVRANRCLAYAQIPAMGIDQAQAGVLAEVVAAATPHIAREVQAQAQFEAARVQMRGQRAINASQQRALIPRMQATCRAYITSDGMNQATRPAG